LRICSVQVNAVRMKSKGISLLALVLGFAFGYGLSGWLQGTDSAQPETEPEVPSLVNRGPSQPSADIQLLEEELTMRDLEIDRLEADLLAANEALATEREAREAEDEPTDRPSWIRQRITERIEGRIQSLASQYNLTEAQQAAVRDAYNQRVEVMQALRRGEEVEPFNMDAALEGILTEEQFADYIESSQEAIYNRAEVMAAAQTLRLSQSMELSPEVEGQVFSIFNETAQEMMISHQSGQGFDMRATLESRLSEVLTPEQFQTYQENPPGGRGMGGGGGMGLGPPPGP
jgi:Spy/CpxP family protein refolding chaperone